MNTPLIEADDWALDVADRIVGDIPHTIFVRWASDIPERVAAALRQELQARSPDSKVNAFVDEVVRSLPDYLPAHGAARLRAKLIGALLAAGALGEHLDDLRPPASLAIAPL